MSMILRTAILSAVQGLLVGIASLVFAITLRNSALAQIPGRCETPVAERPGEVGCYLIANEALGELPSSPLYWHLYTYPTRAAAEAAKQSRGTVVQAFDKIWIFTISEIDWRPSGGERVAVIGPLRTIPSKPYTARYMEAVFPPAMRAATHRHSGAEAWFLLTGTQCLETPEGFSVARAGEGTVVPQGPPMSLASVGSDTRRSLVLVLHEASEPWITMASDWKPKGLCPK